LRAVAERAQEKETGARGLRSIIEEVMLDIMFDLPEQGGGKSYLITPDVVSGRERLFALPEPKHKSA
jgi:ATP-dependent Clp protease ATP-binding subunit ClpX